jgi:hypothetical protein
LEKDLGLEVSSVRHAARRIIFEIMIWIQLKPSRCIALTAYCQSRPESCAVDEQTRWKAKSATSPDREMIPGAEYFDCRKMSGNPAEIKAQCEPTEPTEGPTDFPRTRRL